jgi:trk system potassium uptake protein TrkH
LEQVIIERLKAFRLTPAQVIVLGFVGMILIGTLLLSLPFVASEGRMLRPMDALFTATSAICVTGLIVQDTAKDFTLFGQVIILFLIQVGGFGYMTIATILLVLLGKRIGMRERLAIQEALNTFTMEGLIRFVFGLIGFTLVIEAAGVVILTLRFLKDTDVPHALFSGIFHAVSAFNNAGFSVFSTSLIEYRTDPVINLTITALAVMGGLGFLVYQDVYRFLRRETFRITVHTKMVLVASLFLLLAGMGGIFMLEAGNPATLQTAGAGERLWVSFFHSAVARTAGFNTVDIGTLLNPTLYLLIILMFIGGSPGSTAGGIKTTTFSLLVSMLWSTFRGHMEVTVFHRRIPPYLISNAFYLASLAMIFVTGTTLVLLYSEGRSFEHVLFEVVSATATVGLSVGDGATRSLSALFSDFGKAVITFCMLAGRIGPLMVGLSASERVRHERFRYPEEKVMIG